MAGAVPEPSLIGAPPTGGHVPWTHGSDALAARSWMAGIPQPTAGRMASSPREQLCRRRRCVAAGDRAVAGCSTRAPVPARRLDGCSAVIVAVLVVLAVLAVAAQLVGDADADQHRRADRPRPRSGRQRPSSAASTSAAASPSSVSPRSCRHRRRPRRRPRPTRGRRGAAVLRAVPRDGRRARATARWSAIGSASRTSCSAPNEWVADLPEQFTDERLVESAPSLLSGVVSVAIVAIVAVAVLVDGENLAARFRRLLSPPAAGAGRRGRPRRLRHARPLRRRFDDGRRDDGDVRPRRRARARSAAGAAGGGVGDAHRSHPADRRRPRRRRVRRPGRSPRAFRRRSSPASCSSPT